MRALAYIFGSAVLGASLLLTGCSGARQMMPTPNVYLNPERDVYADLSAPLKSTDVPFFYITDRTPEKDEEGNLRYGYGRSNSLAFGKTVVDLGIDITWEELREASRTQKRLKPVKLELREVTELARGPNTPLPFSVIDGEIVEDAKFVAQRDRYGHSYFLDAPIVSSDLVLMLRDDLDPGTPGRPIEPTGLRFWRIPPGYPDVQPA